MSTQKPGTDKFTGALKLTNIKYSFFVKYETASCVNSFLVYDHSTAHEGWDEAVAHIEKNHPNEQCVIVDFKLV
jgi:hypothetical protein